MSSCFTFGFFFLFFSVLTFSSVFISTSAPLSFSRETEAASPIPFISSPTGIAPKGTNQDLLSMPYIFSEALLSGRGLPFSLPFS
jgi:hypothetical protein